MNDHQTTPGSVQGIFAPVPEKKYTFDHHGKKSISITWENGKKPSSVVVKHSVETYSFEVKSYNGNLSEEGWFIDFQENAYYVGVKKKEGQIYVSKKTKDGGIEEILVNNPEESSFKNSNKLEETDETDTSSTGKTSDDSESEEERQFKYGFLGTIHKQQKEKQKERATRQAQAKEKEGQERNQEEEAIRKAEQIKKLFTAKNIANVLRIGEEQIKVQIDCIPRVLITFADSEIADASFVQLTEKKNSQIDVIDGYFHNSGENQIFVNTRMMPHLQELIELDIKSKAKIQNSKGEKEEETTNKRKVPATFEKTSTVGSNRSAVFARKENNESKASIAEKIALGFMKFAIEFITFFATSLSHETMFWVFCFGMCGNLVPQESNKVRPGF